MPSTTISISLDNTTKSEMDRIAKDQGKSRSDLVRDLFVSYKFNKTLDGMQALLETGFLKLGLQTDEDFEKYLG